MVLVKNDLSICHFLFDTIAVCGLHDVTTSIPDEIMSKVAKWKEDVIKQTPLNTFRIAELLRSAMFAWLRKPPSRE